MEAKNLKKMDVGGLSGTTPVTYFSDIYIILHKNEILKQTELYNPDFLFG